VYDPKRGYPTAVPYVLYRDPAAATRWLAEILDFHEAIRFTVPNSGGSVLDEPTDQPWGLRQTVVADPEGQRWERTQHVRDVDPADWGAEQLGPLPG
jgi:uncharacterized glyoxalase superfamily protein PhnB